ncbi:MAG: (2Fe-2S)-binding protein [Bdellovibrionales bacterium]|nr:(2Fe-2S)-binding protein [Bdellovibrionales bacterium]
MGDESTDETVIICFCYNVRKKQILEAIAQGATTLEKIQDTLCASTGCGGCEMDVREILAQDKSLEKK